MNKWITLLFAIGLGVSLLTIIHIQQGCINNGMFTLKGHRYLCESMD